MIYCSTDKKLYFCRIYCLLMDQLHQRILRRFLIRLCEASWRKDLVGSNDLEFIVFFPRPFSLLEGSQVQSTAHKNYFRFVGGTNFVIF